MYGTYSPMLTLGSGMHVAATYFSYDSASAGNQVASIGITGGLF